MVSRKRKASDTLLPLRAKVPRTTRNHYLGGNATPSQHVSIGARWMRFAAEAFNLAWDTVKHFTPGYTEGDRNVQESSTPSSHSGSTTPTPPWPKASTSRLPLPSTELPASQPIPRSTLSPAMKHKKKHTQAASISSSSSHPPQREVHARQQEIQTGLPSPPPTQSTSVSSTPSTSLTGEYPDLDALMAQARDKREQKRRGTNRKYHEKEHIYAKAHRAQVKEVREQDRKEIEQELFRIKRASGYGSDFREFKAYLGYRERIEELANREALSPSRSLTDLRAKAEAQETGRRHSYSEDASNAFLRRALERAKATLNAPKPPKPFTPNFEQLRIHTHERDQEIENRLHPKRPVLPETLPPEDEATIDLLLRKRGVISKCVREQVTDRDLSRLLPNQWLNDEIINFYGQMILSRSEGSRENANTIAKGRKQPLDIHYFSSFFWSKLKGEGYEKARLAKWTKKIDIFAKDVVLIPVNHNNAHWTGAAINFRKKRIESYDSMGLDRSNVFKILRQYLDAEHRNKKKKPFDFTGWVDYTSEDIPQQENGYDCGVFTCQFLESLSRGEESFIFRQSNMPYLRRRMIWEIGHVKLRDET